MTFDERKYDFQGDCDYTLVKDCNPSYNLTSFNLTAENIKLKPSDKVAYTEELRLEYEGVVFALRQDGEIRIDNVMVSTPVMHPTGVMIRNQGSSYVVRYLISSGLLPIDKISNNSIEGFIFLSNLIFHLVRTS